MLYNTASLLILGLVDVWSVKNAPRLGSRQLSEEAQPLQSNPLTHPHDQLSSKEVVDEICRSLESASGMVLMLPLRVTNTHVQDERRRCWLVDCIRKISSSCGFRFSERMADYKSIATD